MARRRLSTRAFGYRAGVHVEGTHLTCDAESSATDVVFLSHAQALGRPGGKRSVSRRAGRHELLVTEGTLVLLGRAGERLRRQALPAAFGRPFVLGGLRVEILSAGHLPGSASLLVETAEGPVLYAGTFRREQPGFGAQACELRRAEAVCLDGTFGHPRFTFPPPEEALARLVHFVRDALGSGRAPVLLVPPFSTALEVAVALARVGIAARAHRSILNTAALFKSAGAALPPLGRWTGRLGPEEALLWPPEARDAAALAALPSPRFALVSGFSLEPDALSRVRADEAIPLSNQSGFPDLLAYVEQTGAKQVAVHRGFAEGFAEALRQRGLDAYALGPPRQLELFRG